MKYKIIDFEFFGNIIKLYLGKETLEEWSGEDWDSDVLDSIEIVSPEYVVKTILLVVNPDKFNVLTYEDYISGQYFTKNSMRKNKFPFMSISSVKIPIGEGFWHEDSKRYCLGDIIEIKDDFKKKFIPIGM
jgi:hypothetical protein